MALDTRNEPVLRQLIGYLTTCVLAGRAYLLSRYKELRSYSDDDDVHVVLLALLNDKPPPDARLLRKFGTNPGFVVHPGALKAYVMGVTFHTLRRAYQKRGGAWKVIMNDVAAMVDSIPASESELHAVASKLDLDRACASLSADQHNFFDLIYIEQLTVAEVCAHLDITAEVFYARKSRLVARLRRFIEGGSDERNRN